jgi:hypothetical protein
MYLNLGTHNRLLILRVPEGVYWQHPNYWCVLLDILKHEKDDLPDTITKIQFPVEKV